MGDYLFDLILKTFVSQAEQVPETEALPFFIVTSLGSLISVFFLHLTRHASIVTLHFFILIFYQ